MKTFCSLKKCQKMLKFCENFVFFCFIVRIYDSPALNELSILLKPKHLINKIYLIYYNNNIDINTPALLKTSAVTTTSIYKTIA